jgi:hypothetical protein
MVMPQQQWRVVIYVNKHTLIYIQLVVLETRSWLSNIQVAISITFNS